MSQKAEVADADEAWRQEAEQEATQELLDRKVIRRCWLP
jgi:hypothetical protein